MNLSIIFTIFVLTMKAKTIEELREWNDYLSKNHLPLTHEMLDIKIRQLMSKEQKLIQPEPQTVGEEDIWNKEQMEKVKDYILTESSKQTEEQKKHIIDFANRLSETKQVTEDEILNQLDLIILNWLKSESENTTQLSFDIVEYFKGLSLKESQKGVEEITIFPEKEYHFQFNNIK